MNNGVKVVECPRDAWQGLPAMIPAEAKAAYLRALMDVGFTHIDAVSFVSPQAVPQMADSERVLELLDVAAGVELIAIVVNARGAERAVRAGKVTTLGFPFSISPEFLKRNQHQTEDEALAQLTAVRDAARGAGLNVVAYLSMAFGNPYGDAWSAERVAEGCARLAELGVLQISLADTVGAASEAQIGDVVRATVAALPGVEVGVHLHAERKNAAGRVRAAYEAGCRRFDGALGGLGGCPFAQNELVGNIPTEVILETLKECGAELPELRGVEALVERSARLGSRE